VRAVIVPGITIGSADEIPRIPRIILVLVTINDDTVTINDDDETVGSR